MKRTLIYTRHARGDHQRLESDVHEMQAVLAEHGFDHEQAAVIRDTGTGRAANRPGFQELVAMLDSGAVGVLATPDLSRLAREVDAYRHLYRVLDRDVTVITAGGPLSNTARRVALMSGVIAAASDSHAARRRAKRRRRVDGVGGSAM